MPTLYTWNTPNGQKPAILLEELKVDYDLVPINIMTGVQFESEFTNINPNSKIPAYKDDDVVLFESGAIVQHLADSHESFLARSGQARASALSWCYWQVGGLGPMIGQWAHFAGTADLGEADGDSSYALNRYLRETVRLYEVLEGRLAESPYLAGEQYSIADVMCYPWVIGGLIRLKPAVGESLPEYTNAERWVTDIAARPAVQQAMQRLENAAKDSTD
ncbi:MAG: glutathione S-transferase N-terminal domain-containing protein [Pseudomonadota bacterium]